LTSGAGAGVGAGAGFLGAPERQDAANSAVRASITNAEIVAGLGRAAGRVITLLRYRAASQQALEMKLADLEA
jgi:hypothetical protein